MSVTAGALSIVQVGKTTDSLSSAAATGGTGPYTYQWYRSTTTGFSPGAGSLISGATSLTLADSGLTPGVSYFYVVVATDTGAGNATSNSAQLAVNTIPDQLQNQFAQSPELGMVDLRFNYNTVAVEIDASQGATPLIAGQAVKVVASAGGIPKVIGCAADSDEVFGFINYDIKSQQFLAGDKAELSQGGNVMYLVSVGAINRGAQVQLDLSYLGGVKTITGSSGANIVGWAYDQASAAGQLIRVKLSAPSYAFA
jgi:hypothetical protein